VKNMRGLHGNMEVLTVPNQHLAPKLDTAGLPKMIAEYLNK